MSRPHARASDFTWAIAEALENVSFIRERRKYYRQFRPAKRRGANSFLFDALSRDGVVIVPDFLPRENVRKMLAAVPPLSSFRESPEGDRALFLPDADRIPELNPFFANATVATLASTYISADAVALRRTIGVKNVPGPIPTFEMFHHIDTWRHRLKAWLYLDDVGPDQAPMAYLRGSHKARNWRLPVEKVVARRYRTTPDGYATDDSLYIGCVWPHEAQVLKQRYGFDEIMCTGAAGTLVMFDGRGLHRATPLVSGRRVVLLSYWVHAPDYAESRRDT
jgi:hypothetical protein